MATRFSTKTRMPLPAEFEEPWFETVDQFFGRVDTGLYAGFDDRNLPVFSEAVFSFNASTGTVSWDKSIFIFSHLFGVKFEIPAASVVLTPGKIFGVLLDRSTPAQNPETTRTPIQFIRQRVVESESQTGDMERALVLFFRFNNLLIFRNGVVMASGESDCQPFKTPCQRQVKKERDIFQFEEIPSGLVNGTNKTFTTSKEFVTGSLRVWLDGGRMRLGTDYNEINNSTFQFTFAPASGSKISVDYLIKATAPTIVISNVVRNETPTGVINGSNTVFTVANNFTPLKLQVYLDGLRLRRNTDYTEGPPNQFMMTFAPTPGMKLYVDYFKTPLIPELADFVIGEVPSGEVNGVNTQFTVLTEYEAGEIIVFVDGARLRRGVDWFESGPVQITFTFAPIVGSKLYVDYVIRRC